MPPSCWPAARREPCVRSFEARARSRHERDRARMPCTHRRLRAHGGRAGEGLRPRQVHGRFHRAAACWRGASIAAPMRTPRSSRSMSSEAAKLPGVLAIVTGADCDKPFGVLPIARNEYPLARDKVRYKGEPVAAVAAIDEATADKAIRLIRMRVRELPAYFTARRRAGARRRAAAREEARQPRARRALRARQRGAKASPPPTWCARPPTTAPRCARTRWRCTPPSPTTTPCATGSPCMPPRRCPTTCT